MIVVLFFWHLFNKESNKQIATAMSIQTLKHMITSAQEAEIKLKTYEGLNNDYPLVMYIHVLHSWPNSYGYSRSGSGSQSNR